MVRSGLQGCQGSEHGSVGQARLRGSGQQGCMLRIGIDSDCEGVGELRLARNMPLRVTTALDTSESNGRTYTFGSRCSRVAVASRLRGSLAGCRCGNVKLATRRNRHSLQHRDHTQSPAANDTTYISARRCGLGFVGGCSR